VGEEWKGEEPTGQGNQNPNAQWQYWHNEAGHGITHAARGDDLCSTPLLSSALTTTTLHLGMKNPTMNLVPGAYTTNGQAVQKTDPAYFNNALEHKFKYLMKLTISSLLTFACIECGLSEDKVLTAWDMPTGMVWDQAARVMTQLQAELLRSGWTEVVGNSLSETKGFQVCATGARLIPPGQLASGEYQ